jgi:hypothetical protein
VSDGGRTRNNRDHNPVLCQLNYAHHPVRRNCASSRKLVRPARLELATYGLEIRCSIQLSYGRIPWNIKYICHLIKSCNVFLCRLVDRRLNANWYQYILFIFFPVPFTLTSTRFGLNGSGFLPKHTPIAS